MNNRAFPRPVSSVGSPSPRSARAGAVLLLAALAVQGCAAFHPMQGVPAAYVPDEYLGPSRSGKKTIDLSLLVQRQPDQYRLAAGDILAVYVPGVLGTLRVAEQGEIGETPPINLPQSADDPPTIGYPTAVRDDGTISLPLVPPITMQGLTLAEAEEAVRQAYTVHTDILNDERNRILISLARRREYRVLVVRQETSNERSAGVQPGTVNIGSAKRGTAKLVRLPAYENDVLHALAKADGGADGLPGLDAKNTIYIIRRKGPRAATAPVNGVGPHEPDVAPTPLDWEARAFGSASGLVPQPPASPPRSPNYPAPRISVPPLPGSLDSQQLPGLHSGPTEVDADASTLEPSPVSSYRRPVDRSQPRFDPGPQPRPQQSAPTPTFTPAPPTEQPPQPATDSPLGPPQVPLWPRPAEPAESLRRTSTSAPPLWGHATDPVIRGQSPELLGLGHSGFNFSPAAASIPIRGQSSRSLAEARTNAGDFSGYDERCRLLDFDPTVDNPNVTKIPIRLAPGDCPTFTEQDIILQDGDIVFIESRETEVFYTGGLLGGGQYTLPRDYDLGVLEAISIAQSPQTQQNQSTRAIGGISAMNMDVTFSASHVIILRQLVNGTRMPIEVDLYKALRRPETENILIQPGDLVILQYTKLEALGAFIERHLLEGALFGVAAAQFNNNGN